MNTFKTLAFAQNDVVTTLTLDRPDVRNTSNETVIAELAGAFRTLADKPGVRAITLTGNGPILRAGADLSWMKKVASYSDDGNRADALCLAEMLRAIYTCPKPVVARVQGDTYADGVGLVAVYDVVIAVDTVSFCLSGTEFSLVPATISPYVTYVLGEQVSRRYFITVGCFSVAETHHLGFVHELVSAGAFDARVADITTAFAVNNPNTVRESKRLMREISNVIVSDALLTDTTEHVATVCASGGDHEDVQSFPGEYRLNWLLST